MSLNLSSPLEEWEFKLRGFITSQLLAHYFLGVGSLRLLFLPSDAAEGGRLIGPAGCFCCVYKESSISHCGDLALMAGHRQGQHPPIAWMTSIVGSRRDSMVFWGGFKPQVIFFRHSAAGGKKQKTSEEEGDCDEKWGRVIKMCHKQLSLLSFSIVWSLR